LWQKNFWDAEERQFLGKISTGMGENPRFIIGRWSKLLTSEVFLLKPFNIFEKPAERYLEF
jgi:hypothetical protein